MFTKAKKKFANGIQENNRRVYLCNKSGTRYAFNKAHGRRGQGAIKK